VRARREEAGIDYVMAVACSARVRTNHGLSELIRVAEVRWSVKECFQAGQEADGLDHYQVRHWTSWHRHIMLAQAFLTAVADGAAPNRPVDLHPSARSRDPIALTVPKIRHLLTAVFTPPLVTAARPLHWSNWRRQHQAKARRSHYRQQSADEPTG
jgi:hypothetical protein